MIQLPENSRVYVWDPLVRFFHWTLVLAFTIAYVTGEEESNVHVYAGYYILGLVAFRILWGFVGSRHARFSAFITPPNAVTDYLKGFIGAGSDKHYLGHNPAGGWMVVALLISLLATSLSGLQVYGLEGHGPLAQQQAMPRQNLLIIASATASEREDHDDDEHGEEEDEDETEDFWEEIHEFFANLTLLLILVHIAGVIASSLKQRQNLAKAMITGYKRKS